MAVSVAALDLGAIQGAAVLELLERAKVPPQPPFYKLLYDYVSGTQGLFSVRIRDIIEGDEAAGDRLYSEFVAPYESKGPTEDAVARMVARLEALDVLIGESAEASRAQSASLRNASARFEAERLDLELIRDWVGRLQQANLKLIRANQRLDEELTAAHAELEATRAEIGQQRENTRRDPLTGLANRGGLDFAFARLIESREGSLGQLSCAVIDIDHFKQLNDGYGHQVGDEILRIVSRALLAESRSSDIVGRSGGDEFVVILPGAGLSSAHWVGDALRMAIAASDVTAVLGPDVVGGITASVGVAEFRHGDTLVSFIERADRCLYRAKQAGRNRVESNTGG